MSIESFAPHIHEKLKYYVYIYRDPRNDEIFYVGKGKGNRAFSHLKDTSEKRKSIRLAEIAKAGKKPIIEILTHGLESEETALKVEAAIIDLLESDILTNEVRGHHATEFGIMDLDQVRSRYDAKETPIVDKVCLIRINKLFRYGMSAQELYDSTRGIWRVNPERHDAVFALAVFGGVVQEVYRIATWFKAGTTYYSSRQDELGERLHGVDAERYEFVGSIAEEKVRRRYRYKSVKKYLSGHSQNPIRYVNC